MLDIALTKPSSISESNLAHTFSKWARFLISEGVIPDRDPPQDDARSRIWNTFVRNLEERRVGSLHASLAVRDFLLQRPNACVGRKVATCYPKSSVVLSEGDEVVRITQHMRGLT